MKNGILYTKDKTELVAYPIGKTDKEFDVPTYVTKLGWGAFDGSKNLEKIVVPNSVTEIEGAVFQDCEKAKIYCKSDSKAKEYAEENFTADGIEKCLVVDDTAPTISIEQQDKNIIVTATDDSVGLINDAYSLDKENWTSNNKFTVDKSGKYTVYVRDRLGNISSKEINVTIVEKKEEDKKTSEEYGKQTENKNEKNEDKDIKVDNTKEDKKVDNTAAKKEFGQYGSTSIVVSILVILTIAGYIAYIKYKKINVK